MAGNKPRSAPVWSVAASWVEFNLDKSVAAAVNEPVAVKPAKLHHPPSEIISIFLWFLGS